MAEQQALTHPNYLSFKNIKCYERLEFLGDSIIDFLITKYIYETCNNLTPGQLTDIRAALVNNITFASLSVKYGLHTVLQSICPKLHSVIEQFACFQEKQNHSTNARRFKVIIEKDGYNISEYIEAPKVLGDIFESIIGAIYLDCGKNLSTVWTVIYRLMYKDIMEYITNTPKQPIRAILEMPNLQPQFSKAQIFEKTNKICVSLTLLFKNKVMKFNGIGSNGKQAKCAAAEHALDYISRFKE